MSLIHNNIMAFNLSKALSIADMYKTAEKCEEVTTLPTMVLPCHNLSIEQIYKDYCCGVLHNTGLIGNFDTDDPDAEPVDTQEFDPEDIIQTAPPKPVQLKQEPPKQEPPKQEPTTE